MTHHASNPRGDFKGISCYNVEVGKIKRVKLFELMHQMLRAENCIKEIL